MRGEEGEAGEDRSRLSGRGGISGVVRCLYRSS